MTSSTTSTTSSAGTTPDAGAAAGAHPRSLRARALSRRGRRDWDQQAASLGGSYLGSSAQLHGWTLKRWGRMRLHRWEIRDDQHGVVGLCAVAVGSGGGRFLDRLLLQPGHEDAWPEAMAAVLEALPPGTYRYGWEENLEVPREDLLRSVPGVRVGCVRPFVVHCVEFSDFTSWEDYYRAISTNIRRNVKKARATYPDLMVDEQGGRAAIWKVLSLVRLRAAVFRRKGIGFDERTALVSALSNALVDPRHGFVALARSRAQVLAAFRGARFGETTHYLEGGSSKTNAGASWYLLMTMMEQAYRSHPQGRLVMGYLDRSIHDEAVGGGLLRQRRSCRAREFDTSIVTFDWAGPTGR